MLFCKFLLIVLYLFLNTCCSIFKEIICLKMKEQIKVIENAKDVSLIEEIIKNHLPVVLRGMDVGPCIEKWCVNYLSDALGSHEVKIHVSNEERMDFIRKNFLYKSLPFDELLKRASETEHEDFFLSKTEYYYLRSLGKDPRKDAADVCQQFPTLANDFKIPLGIPKDRIFSTVFRISSANVSLWTHYDIMDNMLIQIQGKKRAVLFPPEDASKLCLNGDKSEILDIDEPNLVKYASFADVHWHEAVLEKGDILFIPALWFHNMKYLEFGIALNVFWKNLDEMFYDHKDCYGNKDLLPAQRAFNLMNKAVDSLESLPEVYKRFYYQRLQISLEKRMSTTK